MSGDFLLTITIKNNRIVRAMREEGFETNAELARAAGISPSDLSALLGMKKPPLRRQDGEWRDVVMRLANTLRRLPEDLFPEAVRQVALITNRVEREISAEQVAALTAPRASDDPEKLLILGEATKHLSTALAKMPPRQRQVLTMRYGLDGKGERGFHEIAEALGVSKGRASQIELTALRRLRYQKRYKLHDGLVDDIAGGTE